jgi:hypothetical protein
VIALRVIASGAREGVERLLVLHAFGDDLEAEGMRELDGRADDRGAAGIGRDVRDEGAVDLELVDREVAEVGEGAVAGAVVVDRDAQPEHVERLEDLAGALGVDHDHALGDLELERARGHLVLGEQPFDPFGQRLVEQIGRRQVDGDADVEAGPAPARELSRGGLEHELGERAHEAALLHERQEGVRVEQPAGGMLPAHERLRTERGSGHDVDLRLVVQDELVLAERRVEILDRVDRLTAQH